MVTWAKGRNVTHRPIYPKGLFHFTHTIFSLFLEV